MRYLVSSRKAEITKKDTDGWTCFNRAVYGNHISVVKYFLQQGASADCYNEVSIVCWYSMKKVANINSWCCLCLGWEQWIVLGLLYGSSRDGGTAVT